MKLKHSYVGTKAISKVHYSPYVNLFHCALYSSFSFKIFYASYTAILPFTVQVEKT